MFPMDVLRISSTSACDKNGMSCWVKKPTTRGARGCLPRVAVVPKKKRRSSSHHNCKPTETYHYHVSNLNPRPIVVKTGLLRFLPSLWGPLQDFWPFLFRLLRSGMYCGMHPGNPGVVYGHPSTSTCDGTTLHSLHEAWAWWCVWASGLAWLGEPGFDTTSDAEWGGAGDAPGDPRQEICGWAKTFRHLVWFPESLELWVFIQSLSVTLDLDHHFFLVPQNPSGEPIIFQGPWFDERNFAGCRNICWLKPSFKTKLRTVLIISCEHNDLPMPGWAGLVPVLAKDEVVAVMKARQQQKQTNRIRVRCPSTFSSDKAMWREYFTIDCNWLVLSILFIFFPNSVSLGSSAIVKVPEQVEAAKSALRKVPKQVPRKRFPFPGKFPSKVPRKRFPSKGSQQEVPKQGSQEGVNKQGSQEDAKQGSQVKVSKQGLPSKRFPGKVSRKRFPSKVLRKRFPSKGSQEEVPKQGSQEEVPKQGSQEQVPKQGSQARFPPPWNFKLT